MSNPNFDTRYAKTTDVTAAIAAQAVTDAGQYPSKEYNILMIAGMVNEYDPLTQTGTMLIDTRQYSFTYNQGQNIVISEERPPVLTGHHEQSDGCSLRQPERGDGILVELSSDDTIERWGYMNHFEFLTKRKYPSLVPFA